MAAAAGKVVDSLLGGQANPLVAAIVGGVIGNRADGAVCAAFSASWDYFKNLRTTDPPLNRDFERATREAYLVATIELIRQAEQRLEVASAGATLFRADQKTLTGQLRRGAEADLRDVGNKLPAPVDDAHLLLLDSGSAQQDRIRRLREALESNLKRDANRWLNGAAIPEAVTELLAKGWMIDTAHQKGVQRDWHSLIAIAFIEKVKSDPRLAAVFQSRLLARIAEQDSGAASIATMDRFTARLDELAAPLQRIEDTLGVMRDELRALREDLSTQRAVQIALDRQIADESEARIIAELDQRDRGLRELILGMRVPGEELRAARLKLDAVIAERDQLVERMAQGDRQYAAEVDEFRRQIAGLTGSASPELREAMQRFADGDRRGAFPVIEQIVEAENRAAERATAVRSAERLREVASLALIMMDRGEKTTVEVLALWERVQAMDLRHHWGWVELARLCVQAGDLARARRAAEQSLEAAADDRAR